MLKTRINFLIILLLLVFAVPPLPQLFHENQGESISFGTVDRGHIVDAYQIPYQGSNFKFFSTFDYYFIGRCYTHSGIYKAMMDTYKELALVYPGYTFRIMECSQRKGGRAFPHKTHQNGLSVDFMTPLKKGNDTDIYLDRIGMLRYLLKFDEEGKSSLDSEIHIDFEKLALHLLILDRNVKKHGLKISKVILQTNLKDDLFKTAIGMELHRRGIYFVKSLPKRINELHDDHYHVEFDEQ